MQPLERTILRELFASREFAERVIPYLKEEYFYSAEAGIVYRLYSAFYQKFNAVPKFAAIRIGLDALTTLSEREVLGTQAAIAEIEAEEALTDDQTEWLLEQTEEFCQDRAVYVAVQKAIRVMNDPQATRHVIPDLMKEALAVSFDNHVGHDFFDDADARYDFYHKAESRIPFDIDTLNQMTKGGVPRKTLNVVMAGTNVGKSLALCHFAAASVRMGLKALYITGEMAEERIAERIDANMMNIPIDDLEMLPRSDYIRKIHHLKATSNGRLVIKEYPTSTAHAGHFRALLNELRLKQNFVPDVLFVDYLTICTSSRIKMGSNVNSYTLYKFVAEELRGIGVEFELAVWTAAQFNRTGFTSSDPSLADVGDSWAIAQTADFMFALVQTEELEKLGQLALQPMKNRYQSKKTFQQHLLGVDTDRMKLYDLSAGALSAGSSVPPPAPVSTPQSQKSGFSLGRTKRRPLASLKKDAEDE